MTAIDVYLSPVVAENHSKVNNFAHAKFMILIPILLAEKPMAGDTQAVQRYQASSERTAVLGGIQHKRKLYSQLDNFVEQDVVTDEEDEFCTCAMKIKRQVRFSNSNFGQYGL